MEKLIEFVDEVNDCLEDGTERTLYSPIGEFLTKYYQEENNKVIKYRSERSSKSYDSECGFPDITIKDGKNRIIGFIEVKLPKDSLDADKFEEQFNRYKNSLENIIFTNLKVWQLYQWKNNKVELIAEGKLSLKTGKANRNLNELLEKFISFNPIPIKNPKKLSLVLARKTSALSGLIEELVEHNESIIKIKKAFSNTILKGIDDRSFANLVSESLTYSLFVAHLFHNIETGEYKKLTLTNAIDYIPKQIPVLGDLYRLTKVAVGKIPELNDVIETILDTFGYSNLDKIIESLENGKGDPILYFYEEFLKEYDKETKKQRGVFYTPRPVVDFITRSLDEVLVNSLGTPDGLVDRRVKLLDPATGTGTFLHSCIELIHSKIVKKFHNLGLEKEQFEYVVRDHILNNFFGFEFMLAPYTVSHLKLAFLLKREGITIEDNERFKIFLANTLDNPEDTPIDLLGFESITEESKQANLIKKKDNILAVVGNPPYSNYSVNKNEYISNLLNSYKDGLTEQKINLDDDYIKFMRFTQEILKDSKDCVFSMITNNSFLDGVTHRIMRKELFEGFDHTYILNLHGNSKRGETDKNIFDIQLGVCIFIFVRTGNRNEKKRFYYHSILSNDIKTREEKFEFLNENSLESIKWIECTPKAPNYWFVPINEEKDDSYKEFWPIDKIFNVFGSGVKTDRDSLVIDSDSKSLARRMKKLFKEDYDEDFVEKYNVADTSSYKLTRKIENNDFEKQNIRDVWYKPFDKRSIYYKVGFTSRPSTEVMKNFITDYANIGLVFSRQVSGKEWQHCCVTDGLCESGYVSNKTRDFGYVAPLYLVREGELDDSLESNFNFPFRVFKDRYLSRYSDEDIFYYILGLLNSNSYSDYYNEEMKKEFPRIDFSYDVEKVSKLGLELSDLFLLKHEIINQPENWPFKIVGKDYKVSYSKKSKIYSDGKIYLNENCYIEGVDEEVYRYVMGAYQVCERFIVTNKDLKLKHEEILNYLKMLASVWKICSVKKEIDSILKDKEISDIAEMLNYPEFLASEEQAS